MLVIHTFLEITIICTVTENSYTNQNCNSYGKSFDRLTIIKTNRKHFFQKLEIYLFFFPLPSNREEFVENFVEKKKKKSDRTNDKTHEYRFFNAWPPHNINYLSNYKLRLIHVRNKLFPNQIFTDENFHCDLNVFTFKSTARNNKLKDCQERNLNIVNCMTRSNRKLNDMNKNLIFII